MILEFSVKNFLSFKEKVTFSMIANSNKELNDNYVEIGGNKVLKSAAIYGANASGKSNLFKILTLVVLMLRSSNSVDINAKLPLIPFKLDKGSVNKPSEFEIKFILDETRYVYGFIADKDKIYDEYLYYYPNGRETKIFDRTNINEYSYTQKDEKILREIEAKNAQNKFFLATATNWNFDKTKAAYNFLTNGIGTCNNLEILKNMAYKMYETNPDYLKDFANLNTKKISNYNLDIELNNYLKTMTDLKEDNKELNTDEINELFNKIDSINEVLIANKKYYNKNNNLLMKTIKGYIKVIAKINNIKVQTSYETK